MYYKLKTLNNYSLITEDEHLAGVIDSILFDEGVFGVQYVVVRTVAWLPERLILLSPFVLGDPDQESMQIPVKCSKTMIESSPGIEAHAPVSFKHKQELAKHYGWPVYHRGMGGDVPGIMSPPKLPVEPLFSEEEEKNNPMEYPLWRSSKVAGYRVLVERNELGSVDDFIVEEPGWMLRYIVVKQGKIRHKRTLVLTHFIQKIDFDQSTLSLSLRHDQFENGLEFEEENPISEKQQQQMRLFWKQHQI